MALPRYEEGMILVTGGTGLTGGFVVKELLRRGHAVRVLCRTEVAARSCATGAEVVVGDLNDPASLQRAARGTSGIVHAACTVTDSGVDIRAMEALLEAWEAGPFVFVSTLDVYGFGDGNLITEDTPLSEDYGDYGRGKVVCERLLADAARRRRRGGHTSLRAPHIWGPHPTARRRLLGERLAAHRPIVLPGVDAAQWASFRDAWVDVRDMAAIVAPCMARPASGPLNVATGHFSWHDLFVELIRWTGSRSELVHKPLDDITEDELPRKQLFAQTWRFSEARLAQHLGTIPRLPFEVTVRDTVLSPEGAEPR